MGRKHDFYILTGQHYFAFSGKILFCDFGGKFAFVIYGDKTYFLVENTILQYWKNHFFYFDEINNFVILTRNTILGFW